MTGAETDIADGASDVAARPASRSADADKATASSRGKGRARSKGKARTSGTADVIEVTLEHARWRHFGWMIFGLVAGVVLVAVLGLVGKLIGVVLCGIGLLAAYHFVRTLRFPAGRIRIDDGRIVLPTGLCRGAENEHPLDDIEHAYFLRRAVPWTRAGPVMVIETGERAYTYPRDWFAAEADQRRIVKALLGHLGRL